MYIYVMCLIRTFPGTDVLIDYLSLLPPCSKGRRLLLVLGLSLPHYKLLIHPSFNSEKEKMADQQKVVSADKLVAESAKGSNIGLRFDMLNNSSICHTILLNFLSLFSAILPLFVKGKNSKKNKICPNSTFTNVKTRILFIKL